MSVFTNFLYIASNLWQPIKFIFLHHLNNIVLLEWVIIEKELVCKEYLVSFLSHIWAIISPWPFEFFQLTWKELTLPSSVSLVSPLYLLHIPIHVVMYLLNKMSWVTAMNESLFWVQIIPRTVGIKNPCMLSWSLFCNRRWYTVNQTNT
jgi:hypothetical protein